MKIYKRKLSLWRKIWFKIDMQLLKIGNYLMYKPSALIYILSFGAILFSLLFAYLGYNFLMYALNGAVGYYFGFGVMILFEYYIIKGLFSLKKYKVLLEDFNMDRLNDMAYGGIFNPIIDKIKKK